MDHETLQALIKVYKARASTDLLSIIMDEAEGPQAQAAVLELLRSLSPDSLADEAFAPVRRKACHFCLAARKISTLRNGWRAAPTCPRIARCARVRCTR